MSAPAYPMRALKPPRPLPPVKPKGEGFCPSCERPVDLQTGECSGCTGT